MADGNAVVRDILGHDCPCARSGPRTHDDRSDEHRVGTDKRILSDHRLVLGLAIEIARNRAGADIRALANIGVAEVAEMSDLDALADSRFLEFGMCTDVGARLNRAAGADRGVGADLDFIPQDRAADGARFQDAVTADGRISHDYVWPDSRSGRNRRATTDMATGLDHSAWFDDCPSVYPNSTAVGDVYAPLAQSANHTLANDVFSVCSVGRRLNVESHAAQIDLDRDCGPPRYGRRNHICGVSFTVCVLNNVFDFRPEKVAAEQIEAQIDLVDGSLVAGCVSPFDDSFETAVLPAKDSSHPGWVVDSGRSERGITLASLEKGTNVARRQQGEVAVDDKHMRGLDMRSGGKDGVGGTSRFLLDCESKVRVAGVMCEGLTNQLAAFSRWNHGHRLADTGVAEGVDHVGGHGATADWEGRFGHVGTQAFAETSGKHHGSDMRR